MQIINSTADDLSAIFNLYEAAIAFQKTIFYKHWQGFEESLILKEISEGRQFKIMIDDTIVCIFATTFNDDTIWGKMDASPSVYIHRIVTNPAFRGNNYVKTIIDWATNYGKQRGKQFVRMDTWGDNLKLIDYYQKCGFTFIGLSKKIANDTLPKHYQGIQLSLFEIEIN